SLRLRDRGTAAGAVVQGRRVPRSGGDERYARRVLGGAPRFVDLAPDRAVTRATIVTLFHPARDLRIRPLTSEFVLLTAVGAAGIFRLAPSGRRGRGEE